MVHATTMTLVMAEKDPPVFRDFLGIGRKDESSAKQPQPSSGSVKRNNTGFDEEGEAETSTRASSGNSARFDTPSAPGLLTPPFGMTFPTSGEPGSDVWLRARAGALQHHGVKSAFYKPETDMRPMKRRESPVGRESLQERLQMSVEALENSRPSKVARVEQKDDKKGKFRSAAATMDELRLCMQPPRPSSKGVVTVQTNVSKPELSSRISSKQDRSRTPMNVGVSPPVRLSHLGMSSEKPPGQLAMESNLSRENMDLSPSVAPPAADEGSRTGIKGSGLLAGLQQSVAPTTQVPGMSGGPSPPPRRPKVSAHGAGSDCMLSSRHQFPTTPSRQLTIFYGGQAHVFDDVLPEKASHIMQLAGSNGRSWSTTYSPRQTTSIANSASEGSLSAMEREREKSFNMSRGGSASGGNLALSSEFQTLVRGLAQSGAGRNGQGTPPADASAVPSATEVQLAAAERAAANGIRKDSSERRALTRPTPFTEDNAKEMNPAGFASWATLDVNEVAFKVVLHDSTTKKGVHYLHLICDVTLSLEFAKMWVLEPSKLWPKNPCRSLADNKQLTKTSS